MACHKDQEKFQLQLIKVQKKLAAAKASASSYKALHKDSKRKVNKSRRKRDAIRIKCDQLALAVDDREADRNRLAARVVNLETGRDRAILDRDSLLARLAGLLSGAKLSPPSSLPAGASVEVPPPRKKRQRKSSISDMATSKRPRRSIASRQFFDHSDSRSPGA